ncbi:MAG: iron-sulfur cluster assembly scaffold protein [Candidatus Cryosericum sp.]|jgi:nitrogen fixation NifU-like protein|nr:iron-sulfur cluster assembly scaffold protein [Candidatus Cryosericum sp.]
MDKYSRATIREFMSPSNIGSIENPSGVGHITDNADAVELTVYIAVEGGRITDMKYRIAGCTALIATLSVLSREVLGMTVEDAFALDMAYVSRLLDGLPESKWRCAGYALQALQMAISDYRSRAQ